VIYFSHMDQPRSTSRYILVALCIVVVFTALVLVALNAWMKSSGNPLAAADRYQEGYSKGYSDAREHLRTLGMIIEPADTRSFSGSVVSVGSGSLVVKQTSLDTDPIIDKVPDERNVTVASSTKIYRRTEKDPAVLEKEMRAFEADVKENPNAVPPESLIKTDMKLSDINVGAKVVITSASEVRLASTIVATEVVVVQ